VTAESWGVDEGYFDPQGGWHLAPRATVDAILGTLQAGRSAPSTRGTYLGVGERPDLGPAVITTEDGADLAVDGPIPALPPGYHLITRRDGAPEPLVVSPRRCFLPPDLRCWGWAVQLYAARSRSSWGLGDLGDLGRLARWSRRLGAEMLLVNPLHAVSPTLPQQPSPYFPGSRRFRNPIYIDVERIPGVDRAAIEPLAAQGRALNAQRKIDRDAVWRLKLAALEQVWTHARDLPVTVDRLATQPPELHDWGLFCALSERFRPRWREWPAVLRDPRSPGAHAEGQAYHDRIRFHRWLQAVIEDQLQEVGDTIGVVHDLAIGIDPDGADAWMQQDVLAPGFTVGAPPDIFNRRGQNWALPPFDPHRLREDGFSAFVQVVRSAMQHAAGIRFDHVMGLFRLYWIPDGCEPDQGAYVRYPAGPLLDILAIESWRARSWVVGEDLGTVEDVVRDEMAARDLLSYRLLWFEDAPTEQFPRRALSAITTHDLPTITGLWSGQDLEDQRRAGVEPSTDGHAQIVERVRRITPESPGENAERVIVDLHTALAGTPSMVVTATLDDAMGVAERPNLPGLSPDEWPCWSLALPHPIEELETSPLAAAVAAALQR
jgi:4-alpha-glucanotransferase